MTTAHWASDRVYVFVVWELEPTDSEWADFLDACRLRANKDIRALIESYGAGPNAKQRKELSHLLAELHIDYRAAILTDSLISRGIVTAFAWLGVTQRAFPPRHYTEAGSYLQYTAAELNTAIQALARLAQPQLGQASPA